MDTGTWCCGCGRIVGAWLAQCPACATARPDAEAANPADGALTASGDRKFPGAPAPEVAGLAPASAEPPLDQSDQAGTTGLPTGAPSGGRPRRSYPKVIWGIIAVAAFSAVLWNQGAFAFTASQVEPEPYESARPTPRSTPTPTPTPTRSTPTPTSSQPDTSQHDAWVAANAKCEQIGNENNAIFEKFRANEIPTLDTESDSDVAAANAVADKYAGYSDDMSRLAGRAVDAPCSQAMIADLHENANTYDTWAEGMRVWADSLSTASYDDYTLTDKFEQAGAIWDAAPPVNTFI